MEYLYCLKPECWRPIVHSVMIKAMTLNHLMLRNRETVTTKHLFNPSIFTRLNMYPEHSLIQFTPDLKAQINTVTRAIIQWLC